MSTHIKSDAPTWQLSPEIAWWWDLIPHGQDLKQLIGTTRTIPGTGATIFDLKAPLFARLARAQADGTGPTAEVVRLTFGDHGFRIKARCPFCDAYHYHGGGVIPLPRFGHRVADCGRGGYVLTVGAGK